MLYKDYEISCGLTRDDKVICGKAIYLATWI